MDSKVAGFNLYYRAKKDHKEARIFRPRIIAGLIVILYKRLCLRALHNPAFTATLSHFTGLYCS
jgi:hypothetical protein